MYYHAKVFTATSTGQRIKNVTCEKCATTFYYELVRIGTGRASAPYGIGQDSAKQRAQNTAQKNLAKRLDRDVELVPCPACRWVNAAAIHQYRKTRHQAWMWLAVITLIVAAGVDLLLYTTDILGKPITLADPHLWIVTLTAFAVAISAILIRRAFRLRINPNNLVNGVPSVPPGTPPALVQKASESGQIILAPVPSEFSNLQTDATWATFRPGQLKLPPLCCECLEPSTCTFKLPMTVSNPLIVPLCHSCLRRLRMQWILRNLAMLPFAFFAGWLVARLPRGIDDTGRIIMTVLVGCVAAIIGFVIIDMILHPYRFRSVDASRGISKISFKNPAYTALLIRQIGQADGLYQDPPVR